MREERGELHGARGGFLKQATLNCGRVGLSLSRKAQAAERERERERAESSLRTEGRRQVVYALHVPSLHLASESVRSELNLGRVSLNTFYCECGGALLEIAKTVITVVKTDSLQCHDLQWSKYQPRISTSLQ